MSMSTENRQRKQKHREPYAQPTQSGVERLKTVVRRLPPNLPEEVFWQSVQAWVSDDTVTWKSYYPGKFRTKRMNKEGIPSRAYIAFRREDQVATFSREYDGHVFRDKTGNESHALVEFAPFQKTPTEKKKADARNNTIDKDDDYLSFLETLKRAGKTESLSLEALVAASQSPPPPTTTPLLEALKAEKQAQKDKETILRNHAHYKDAALKKEEAKKKAVAAVQPAKQDGPAPVPPLSKKARKAAAVAATTTTTGVPKGVQHEGQGKPSGGPASVKPPSTGQGRHRPKEPHARQLAKGDPSGPLAVPTAGQASTDGAPSAMAPAQRKRPVIGLGRHFEAALSSAGVAVSPAGPTMGPSAADRKRRDKSSEEHGKGKRREDAVPSILQRPAPVQRPQSPKEGPVGEVGSAPGTGSGRGSRRGKGKGRGG